MRGFIGSSLGRAHVLVLAVYALSAARGAFSQQSSPSSESSGSSHSSHDHHDHEDHGSDESHAEHGLFEQAAVYNIQEAGTMNLIVVASDAVAQELESFAFMLTSTTAANGEGLEAAEETVELAWEEFESGEQEATVLTADDEATPSDAVVYQVMLEAPLAVIKANVTQAGAYALFFEHGADEIPVTLISASGEVLEAGAAEGMDAEEADSEDEDEEETGPATGKQWANALIASLVISCCSFAGLIVVVSGKVARSIDLSHALIFAAGALLTASLLHVIPEAMEGLESTYPDDLHTLGIRAGVAVLAGISFGVIVHALLESGHSHSPGAAHDTPSSTSGADTRLPSVAADADKHGSDSGKKSLLDTMDASKHRKLFDIKDLQPVCWTIIAGDLVHNFADGVTIGAAFLGCSTTVGWTITASAVLHEVPHELADFMALVNGGMSRNQAFLYNFASALSAVLGTVLILALRDTLTSAQISFILLLGGGSFIFIALSELVPVALETGASGHPAGDGKDGDRRSVLKSQACKLVSFVAGAMLIGIPLIFDRHCEAGHEGHDH